MAYDDDGPFDDGMEGPADKPNQSLTRHQSSSAMQPRQSTEIANPAGVEVKSLTAAMQSAAIEEIRAAFLMAKQFPRNEDAVRAKVVQACKSPTLIRKKQGIYSFKLGGSLVEGLTIHVAKEIARSMTNFRFGSYIIHDTPEQRTIRCWAMDLESNTRDEVDDTFGKMVYRKGKDGGPGFWKVCDERELLMLTNLKASKGIRNCILNLTPFHIRDAALETIYEMIDKKISEDPKQFLRDLLDDFAEVGVTVEEILDFAGVPNVDQLVKNQLRYLRGVVNAIREGATTWQATVQQLAEKKGIKDPVKTASDLASKLAVKAAEAAAKTDSKLPAPETPPPKDPPPASTAKTEEPPQSPPASEPKKTRSRPAATNPDDLVP